MGHISLWAINPLEEISDRLPYTEENNELAITQQTYNITQGKLVWIVYFNT